MGSIFSDRRSGNDRRNQMVTVPADLDRRKDRRRSKYFQAQPWWLKINYATAVSEPSSTRVIEITPPDKPTTSANREKKRKA